MDQTTNSTFDDKRELLRHTVATLAYRGAKPCRMRLRVSRGSVLTARRARPVRSSRTLETFWTGLLAWRRGNTFFHESTPLPWEQEIARFFDALRAFDACLASETPLGFPAEKLFQGPIADALTHVGQIAILRRIAGAPIRGENYFKAEIVAGRVGARAIGRAS